MRAGRSLAVACVMVLAGGFASAQGTWRESVDSQGVQANRVSWDSSVSEDGRFVAFESDATNLVPGSIGRFTDIYVRDRQTGSTSLVSVNSLGKQGNGPSLDPSISADGRWVAFWSYASNLVPGDGNAVSDVFVHDRQTGSTTRVSINSSGVEGNSYSSNPAVSAEGRYVTFDSSAENLVPGDTNRQFDVFLHDRKTATTTRVSVDSSGVQGNFPSYRPSLSMDGRFVAFGSFANNLVPGDTNGRPDVFVHDRLTATTTRVSVDSSGVEGNKRSHEPAISANGRFVVFESRATNLVPGDTNQRWDVFVHDRETWITTRASVASSGEQGDRSSGFSQGKSRSGRSSISGDGRFVAFWSIANNLVPRDTNQVADVFVHGPYLTLEARPRTVPPGATLTMTTWTGHPKGAALLAAVKMNGIRVFFPYAFGTFDAAGLWTVSGIAPPGLSGNDVTFRTLGVAPTGKVDRSNLQTVAFQ